MLQQLEDLFSITAWKSVDGWTVGVQRFAGDPVQYATRATFREAISASVDIHQTRGALPAPPYGVA